MNFSMLYRVLWKPREVFKEVESRRQLAPFIFIGVVIFLSVMNAYWNYFDDYNKQPLLLLLVLMQISVGVMFTPTVNATVIYLIVLPARKVQISFTVLLGIFILCGIPYYLEEAIIFFGYRPIGLGSLFLFLESTQPFLFGMIATLTLFFVWMIYLWWVAFDQLLSLKRWQNTLLVCSLVLIHMLIDGGLWYLVSLLKIWLGAA